MRNYIATIRVTPIVETKQAFVEWWATFDCAAEDYGHWTNHFEKEGFAKWLAALRRFMETEGVKLGSLQSHDHFICTSQGYRQKNIVYVADPKLQSRVFFFIK